MWYRDPVLDAEALALVSLGYRQAFFLELYCATHGAIRIAIATELEPSKRHPCPICGESRPTSGVLCTGYTRQPLPFWERVRAPVVWLPEDRLVDAV